MVFQKCIMNYKTDTHKGLFQLINREKYMGQKLPVYKSGWERKVFTMMDKNPYIMKWGYECIEIYYHNPIKQRFTIYYPDIYCNLIDINGDNQSYLIEIKPAKMTIAPKRPEVPKTQTAQSGIRYKKALERYSREVGDYAVNMAKWEAAQKWCLKNNVKWIIFNDMNSSGLFK